jgi:hypothetical protein
VYQQRARHPLSPATPDRASNIGETMWDLFVAIGEFWKLTDTADSYKLRFRGFMENRIKLNPLYIGFYRHAHHYIAHLIATHGRPLAYEILFTQKDRKVAPALLPQTEVEFIQLYVVNEFIGLRLALGGFKDFSGINYCGYFGGANIADQPVPYRPIGGKP